MSTILVFILGFLMQAVALKLSLGVLGQASAQNKFGTAIGVVAVLKIALMVTAFVPVVGWLLKPLVWLLVIMAVYKIGFFKSIAVAIVQVVFQIALKWILALIGLSWFASVGA